MIRQGNRPLPSRRRRSGDLPHTPRQWGIALKTTSEPSSQRVHMSCGHRASCTSPSMSGDGLTIVLAQTGSDIRADRVSFVCPLCSRHRELRLHRHRWPHRDRAGVRVQMLTTIILNPTRLSALQGTPSFQATFTNGRCTSTTQRSSLPWRVRRFYLFRVGELAALLQRIGL